MGLLCRSCCVVAEATMKISVTFVCWIIEYVANVFKDFFQLLLRWFNGDKLCSCVNLRISIFCKL